MNTRVCKVCLIEKPLRTPDFASVGGKYFRHTCNKCDYQRKRESHLRYYKKRRLDPIFVEYHKKYAAERYASDPVYKNKKRTGARKINIANKKKVFLHYGHGTIMCSCKGCGENIIEFLTIDHINGRNDKQGSRTRRGGVMLYSWLINNGFPEGYRVLCFNCNSVRGAYGYCPHESPELRETLSKIEHL